MRFAMKIAFCSFAFLPGFFQPLPYRLLTVAAASETDACATAGDGTSCNDENSCTYDDVCQDGVCRGTIPTISSSLAVSYPSSPADLETYFGSTSSASYNIGLNFGYVGYANPEPIPVTFEAIISETCGDNNNIIATTNDPVLASGAEIPAVQALDLSITGPTDSPKLEMITDFTLFEPPYWIQVPRLGMGQLQFCVQFQAKLCSRLIDFADVFVGINFSIESNNCEGEDCFQVVQQLAQSQQTPVPSSQSTPPPSINPTLTSTDQPTPIPDTPIPSTIPSTSIPTLAPTLAQLPTSRPSPPPVDPGQCAALQQPCSATVPCCSTSHECKGVCARVTNDPKLTKDALKVNYAGEGGRGKRPGTANRKRRLKGS